MTNAARAGIRFRGSKDLICLRVHEMASGTHAVKHVPLQLVDEARRLRCLRGLFFHSSIPVISTQRYAYRWQWSSLKHPYPTRLTLLTLLRLTKAKYSTRLELSTGSASVPRRYSLGSSRRFRRRDNFRRNTARLILITLASREAIPAQNASFPLGGVL